MPGVVSLISVHLVGLSDPANPEPVACAVRHTTITIVLASAAIHVSRMNRMVRMYSTPSGQATVIRSNEPSSVPTVSIEIRRARPSGPPRFEDPEPSSLSAAGVPAVVEAGPAAAGAVVVSLVGLISNENVSEATDVSVMPITDQRKLQVPAVNGVVVRSTVND